MRRLNEGYKSKRSILDVQDKVNINITRSKKSIAGAAAEQRQSLFAWSDRGTEENISTSKVIFAYRIDPQLLASLTNYYINKLTD
jgi:hypothetical protein